MYSILLSDSILLSAVRCGTPSEINPRTTTSYHGWRRASAEHSASCPCREWTIEDTMRKTSTASSQTAVAAPSRSCKAKLNANTCAARKRRRETSLAPLSTCTDIVGSTRHPERSIPSMVPALMVSASRPTPFADRPQCASPNVIGFFKAGRASQSEIRPEISLSYSQSYSQSPLPA